jgi:hypothetical protein
MRGSAPETPEQATNLNALPLIGSIRLLFGVSCPASCPSAVVGAKCLGGESAQCCLLFNLRSQPDTELQNPLKLLGAVKPSVIVADRVSRKVVIRLVLPAERMGEHVIGFPRSLYDTATNMATACRLLEDVLSFQPKERLPDHLIAECQLLVTSFLSERSQACCEILGG